MRRLLTLSALMALAACGAPAASPWDAWLVPGTAHVEYSQTLASAGRAGTTKTTEYVILVEREPGACVVHMELSPAESERVTTSMGADALELVRALNSRELHISDDERDRVRASPYDPSALRLIEERFAAAGRPSPTAWPETRSWQDAEVTRMWFAWGVPWLNAAERGAQEVTLALPVVGHDVSTSLALGPIETRAGGTLHCEATYSFEGTDARDLNAVLLRQLRESGEEIAASYLEIQTHGTFSATYDATWRPIRCRHESTTVQHDPTTGLTLESGSKQSWTFHWPETGKSD